MVAKNGFKPGSLDWIEQQYEFHRAKAEMYHGVLQDAGVVVQARKQQHASAMLSGALKAEAGRQGRPWMPKETREKERARRHEVIRAFLQTHGDGDIYAVTKALADGGFDLGRDRARQLMGEMSDVERIGSTFQSRYRLRPKKPEPAARAKMKATHPVPWNKGRKMTPAEKRAYALRRRAVRVRGGVRHEKSRSYDGTTAEKARVIAEIIQANGGVMETTALTKAAKEKGVTSLTGMVNYLNAGWLRRTRTPKGESAYRFLKMPPAPAGEPTVETIE